MPSEFVVLAGMIVVGLILFLIVEFFIMGEQETVSEYGYKAEAEGLVSLIERVSSEPNNYVLYCQYVSPSDITVKNGVLTYEKDTVKYSFPVPASVNVTNLKRVATICVLKTGDIINLLPEKPICVLDDFCTPDECKEKCPDCDEPDAICVNDEFCNEYIDENCENSADCDCSKFGKGDCCPNCPERDSDSPGCCPIDIPIATDGHCCSTDQPKYCEKPKIGDSRCMSDDEFKTECQKTSDKFPIFYIPLNYGSGDFDSFKAVAEAHFNTFVTSHAPSKECSDPYSVFEAYYLDPSKCTTSCSYTCGCSLTAKECAIANYPDVIQNSPDYVVAGICKGQSCITCDPSFPGKCCGCSYDICSRTSASLSECGSGTISHELGHAFCFYHIDGICDSPGGPCLGINAGDCSASDKSLDLMTYCRVRTKYGQVAYDYLKNTVFKDYLQGC